MEEDTRLYRVEVGSNINRLLYIKQIANKDLLYSTENYTQHLTINYNGKESRKEYTYIYGHTHIIQP